MASRPTKMGAETPRVTCAESRAWLNPCTPRPRPSPMPMARMIHNGRYRSRNERRWRTAGASSGSPSRACSSAMTVSVDMSSTRSSSAAGRSGASGCEVGSSGTARRFTRLSRVATAAHRFCIGQYGVDLPGLAAGSVNPDLVLDGEAAGDLLFDRRGQIFSRQAFSGSGDLVSALDLDAQVIEGPRCLSGILDQDQLERRIGDGEVGVAGHALRWFRVKQLLIEVDRLVDVGHVESKLDTGHGEPPVVSPYVDASSLLDILTIVNKRSKYG